MNFYKQNDTYVFTTGEAPKGFRNVLYIAWHGKDVDTLEETVLSADQLAAMTPVELPDVPDDWYNAFSNVSGLFAKREPKPEPKAEPKAELWSIKLDFVDLVLIALGWLMWSALKYSLIWPITGAF